MAKSPNGPTKRSPHMKVFIMIALLLGVIWLLTGGVYIFTDQSYDSTHIDLRDNGTYLSIVPAPQQELTIRPLGISRGRIGGPFDTAIIVGGATAASKVKRITVESLVVEYPDGDKETVVGKGAHRTKSVPIPRPGFADTHLFRRRIRLDYDKHAYCIIHATILVAYGSGGNTRIRIVERINRAKSRWKIYPNWRVVLHPSV